MKKRKIKIREKNLTLPAFFPDATYGSVQSVGFDDLKNIGTEGVVTTTIPMHFRGVDKKSIEFGGVDKFFGWEGVVLTDSGGFQILSILHKYCKRKDISDSGAKFQDFRNGNRILLTPELSQQIQHNLNSDIRVVLDEPVPVSTDYDYAKKAVERTRNWAVRSKNEFMKLEKISDFSDQSNRPLLTGVVQGGNFEDLRRESLRQLVEIEFDIFGYGGFPVDENGKLSTKILQLIRDNTPGNKILYGLGVGTPDDIVTAIKIGWELFDCVLPNRNGRHGYLYVSKGKGEGIIAKNFDVIRVRASRYNLDKSPVEEGCDCLACKTISRAYLHHLIRIGEPAGFRLASIHNLRFYNRLIESL